MNRIVILLALMSAQPVYADLVCTEKSTGKLIEYQSTATPGTLIKNAKAEGYTEDQVIEQQVTPQQWEVMKQALIMKPAEDAAKAKNNDLKSKKDSLRQALNLSPQQMDDLIQVVKGLN